MTPRDSDADREASDREQEEVPRVVIRDKRRLDPQTGELRETVPGETPGAIPDAPISDLARELTERTADLQRVSAEYANYRRRVDRDRLASAEQAAAQVLFALLPVLDTIDRARQHGDLIGAFAAAAEQLEGTLDKVGLTAFGEVGDSFDPTRHEAVMHSTSPDVEEPACVEIMRRGYSFGERLLRPAMVAVAEPQVTVPPKASPEADG
ncbi:MAG: nucleotide exchange factor GrpE [Actinomycetota bacterium]|nr:nucleotide exchange factor GrpE [Actinomycetota bacterium]